MITSEASNLNKDTGNAVTCTMVCAFASIIYSVRRPKKDSFNPNSNLSLFAAALPELVCFMYTCLHRKMLLVFCDSTFCYHAVFLGVVKWI